jgi:membrane-associated phospholipid phosphatase
MAPLVLPHLRALRTRFFPHGVHDAVWQIAVFLIAYYGYRIVRGAVDGKAALSFDHGRDIIAIEQATGTFFEPALQDWATANQWINDFASYMYVNSHFTVTISALVFIYLFHNSHYYFVRNMFVVAMAIALVGYVAYPTAPPRFFPEWGFTDSVARFTGIPSESVAANALFNPFAAVPSMHVAFALILGWPLAKLVRFRPLKVFWFLYPLLVTFVVIATGNHYWLDALLGALTAGAAALVADRLMARARPEVWALGRPAEATA